MTHEFIRPNLHIAFVHFPLGLFIIGVLLEAMSFLGWRYSSLRWAARWMILLGAMTALPVALSGLYALADVTRDAPLDPAARESLRDHLIFAASGTLLALLAVSVWIAISDLSRAKLHPLFVVVLLASAGLMGAAAHVAGEAVYVQGVGVGATDTIDAADATPQPTAALARASRAVAPFAPPLQAHLLLAGSGVSLAMISLALVRRRMIDNAAPLPPDEVEAIVALADETVRPRPIALLATGVLILAAAAGVWFVAHDGDTWNAAAVYRQIFDPNQNPGGWVTRRAAHVIVGVTIAALPVLGIFLARFAPRARILWLLISLLFLAAAAAQVWLGVLMLFDDSRILGPVTGWSK